MSGRAELHFHLLPGVDDGPATEEESVALARAAVEDGTATLATTPHVRDVSVGELPDRVRRLRERLGREGIPLDVRCGGELDEHDLARLSAAELETIALGPPGARWLLLEAPLFARAGEGLAEAAEELARRGFGVVLGHPERSPGLFEGNGGDGVDCRIALPPGTRAQVNAHSLLGRHGEEAQRIGVALAASDWPLAVSSDAHSLARGPALGQALQALLAAGVAPERARQVVDREPVRLLEEGLRPGDGA